jgi:hypothetical protein
VGDSPAVGLDLLLLLEEGLVMECHRCYKILFHRELGSDSEGKSYMDLL